MIERGAQQPPRVARARLVLASASPRRKVLLGMLCAPDRIEPADIDEAVRTGEPACEYVLRVALEKARHVARRSAGAWVLGADTAVAVAGRILGKPRDRRDARALLRALSGREHQVFSAVVLIAPDGAVECRNRSSRVWFDALPDDWIRAYVATGEPLDKAGGYAVQGAAAAWIPRIEGSYTGIVGLPLYETAQLLRGAGLIDRMQDAAAAPNGEHGHE